MEAELQVVKKRVKEYLNQFTHNTLSFDGWSSKGHDEIYTVHITNFLRQSFLVDGLLLTGTSTTGEEIFNRLVPIIMTFDPNKMSLVVTDSGKNVRKSRRLICTRWQWILNIPDANHLLNLLAKDLVVGSKTYPKVKGFSDVLATVSQFTTYFAHSNYGRYWLDQEMKQEVDKRGIVAAGGTRFSTFSTNGKSVVRCWPAMKRCVEKNVLKFEGKGPKKVKQLLEDVTHGLRFQAELSTVLEILSPIERGLRTLEGQNTTLSDVFMVFLGVGIAFMEVFGNSQRSIYEYREESFAAYNRRLAFLLEESSDDVFLLAYLLDLSPYYTSSY